MTQGFYKTVVSITCFFIGLLFVFSGSFWKIHTLLVKFLEQIFTIKTTELSILIAISLLIFLTALLAFSPIGSFSIPLLLQIAYELSLGVYADMPVYFLLFLNYIISMLIVFIAAFAAYRQYRWVMRNEEKLNEKSLLKFI
jgi:predicted neutral ceramidase superfamily lipid hydrolase